MGDERNYRYGRTQARRQIDFHDEPAQPARSSSRSSGASRARTSAEYARTGTSDATPRRSGGRSARASAGSASRQATGTTRATRTPRTPQPTHRGAAPRYSDQEIRRNRIIALAVLAVAAVLLVVLVVNLVSCVARAFGGESRDSGEGASANAAATIASASQTAQAESASSAQERQPSAATQTLAADEGVEDPWVEGGRFTTGDAELDEMVKKACDENSSADASAADNAFKAYCAVVWADYVENDDNQHPVGTEWDIEYAKQMFRNNAGNCYEFAAANEFVLKYFGYQDVYAEPCLVYRESGTYGDHGLVFATDFDGKKCMCDSSFGANGWMIDADSYTMQVVDVGQDPSEFEIADFEKVTKASWA